MGWALRWVRCTVPCWLRKKRVCEWSNLLGLESEPVVGWEMINPKPTEIRKKQIVRWTEVESRSKDFLIFLESDPSSSAWISIYSITISLRLKSEPRKRERQFFPLGSFILDVGTDFNLNFFCLHLQPTPHSIPSLSSARWDSKPTSKLFTFLTNPQSPNSTLL